MPPIRIAIGLTVLFTAVWLGVAYGHPLLYLSENQVLYTFSSEAQVIAAVYGLTITGYIFLRNQQDRLSDKDESLIEIIESIQVGQFQFISLITVLSIASIFLALLAITFRESMLARFEVVTQNLAAAFFAAGLTWTGFFVLDVMRPGQIARASRAIAGTTTSGETEPPVPEPGRLEEFLQTFNAIERLLDNFASDHLEQLGLGDSRSRAATGNRAERRSAQSVWTKQRIIRVMMSQRVISESLTRELLGLMRYRNALVHGQEMVVSAEMVRRMEKAKAALERSIDSYQQRRGA